MERTGKGEWEREGAILGEGRGKNADPSQVYIEVTFPYAIIFIYLSLLVSHPNKPD